MKSIISQADHWAPGIITLALKSNQLIFNISLVLTFLSAVLPTRTVRAVNDPAGVGNLPVLSAFVDRVKNGRADELRGVYIPDILAYPIVRQPKGKDDFVSSWENVVTHFDPAAGHGSTGLLAHNYLAGKSFPLVKKNQKIYLVYGDGRTSTFIVTDILHFRAMEPANVSGTFAGLEDGNVLTASQLFRKVYNRPGNLILQTCIALENELAWGRLFVIAQPYSE